MPVRQARPAALFSETPPAYRHGGSGLGADSQAILAEAGLDAAEIRELIEQGIAGAPA